jgi:hypothetical protein
MQARDTGSQAVDQPLQSGEGGQRHGTGVMKLGLQAGERPVSENPVSGDLAALGWRMGSSRQLSETERAHEAGLVATNV